MDHHNKVEMLGHYGGDESHAISAWTSTFRDLTEERKGRIDKLLKMLAKEGHHTPFEKSTLHFLVTCDTASHIHFLKHRIGVSLSGESARYKEHTEDKWLVPDDWPEEEAKLLAEFNQDAFDKYHQTLERLVEGGMDRKRAKESARFYLPYSSQLTLDISFNFRSFMHFIGLRMKPDAQKEIRELAEDMLQLVRDTGQFDLSLAGFGYGEGGE